MFSDVPVAKYICKPQLQEDVRLFDVNLLKWKLFDRGSVQLSFSYILDVRGGLSFLYFLICKNKFNYKFWKQTINKNVVNT